MECSSLVGIGFEDGGCGCGEFSLDLARLMFIRVGLRSG